MVSSNVGIKPDVKKLIIRRFFSLFLLKTFCKFPISCAGE